LLQRNISGERFIGINQRLNPQIADKLAIAVRERGYNARVISSKEKKRLYIGNARPYKKKRGRITDLTKEFRRVENSSKMKTVSPSKLGQYDRVTIQRDDEYARWKSNTFRRNPNLRYVALGAKDGPPSQSYQAGIGYGERAESTERPYLLALGLMPSNVALLYLAELGAPIGPGTDIYDWYQTDRRNLGEEWHRGNMRQIEWHISQKYRSSTSMDDLYNSLTFDGYNIGYKISGSDLEINTDDAIDMTNDRERYLEQVDGGYEKLVSGYLDESLFSFEGGSNIFDLDYRKRAIRLSDWLPDVGLYLNEMEIRGLLNKAKYRMSEQPDFSPNAKQWADGSSFYTNLDRRDMVGVNNTMPNSGGIVIPPLVTDVRRNPTKTMYMSDDQPNYQEILDQSPTMDSLNGFGREMYNDFTYDWHNLQKQQWGGDWGARRGVEKAKLLPYAKPSLLTSIYDGPLGEKIESLDWLPEVQNQLDLLRRINILNVAQVEANTEDELKNAKTIVDNAMGLIANYTTLTDQRLGEGEGEDWPGASSSRKDQFSSGWEYRTRGFGFSGAPTETGDFYSIEERVARLLQDYR
tara:strand:+ start:6422 stop:8158 length:1737 start_codon:yes stop_codon:yes gene_type:complete